MKELKTLETRTRKHATNHNAKERIKPSQKQKIQRKKRNFPISNKFKHTKQLHISKNINIYKKTQSSVHKQKLRLRNIQKLKNKSQNRKQLQKKSLQQTYQKNQTRKSSNLPHSIEQNNISSFKENVFHSLTQDMQKLISHVSLVPKEVQMRRNLYEDVKNIILKHFPTASIELYGSSLYGLETKYSDMDIRVENISIPSITSIDLQNGMDQGTLFHEFEDEKDLESMEITEQTFSLNLLQTTKLDTIANEHFKPLIKDKSPWNPTERRRKVRALRLLQKFFNIVRPQFQIKCLNKAKIPLLIILDRATNQNLDISIFDEKSARGSELILQLIKTLGNRFKSLVIVLKEFLHQFELDKPFSGGIGSFRLYLMCAYIIISETPDEKQETMSHALINFFFTFGNLKIPEFCTMETQLSYSQYPNIILEFTGVYRLQECVELFAIAHKLLLTGTSITELIQLKDSFLRDRKLVKC